ncbi:hypothetical protein F511_03948 [Dorcoceras hygrometricum]|uniref:Uncharacterized protein n=1 Tax=Dorcoceras hygrometricum TaxID=472368 RepID=A0A2Z7BSR1_9LAMI|nr:hypothetical protein F511_03948 [Dorcoceras hygrometricum]
MKKHLVASYCSSAGSYSATSRRYLEIAIAKRCRLHKLIRQRFCCCAKDSAERLCAYVQSAGVKNQQVATVLPVENLFVSAVATLPVVVKSSRKKRRSRRIEEIQPVARFSRKIQQKRKRSSSRLESAGAKQLTTYEELRELDVNC